MNIKHYILGLFISSFLAPVQANPVDTVSIQETAIPILIERQDNELLRIRLDAQHTQTFNEVSLEFGKKVNLQEIESIKLYYSGTEAVEKKGQFFFAPVEYVSGFRVGNTLSADPSYSILKQQIDNPGKTVTLKANQPLFPGINYFWISLQMKPTASLLSKISISVTDVKTNNQKVPFKLFL